MTTTSDKIPEILGESEAILAFKSQLYQAAQVNRPVLILGERGTGKELAAGRLHYLSPRWSGPYLTLNCAALTPGLIESELFGYETGAFTGASKRRQGRFEAADKGALFLDEIGHLPLEAQAKILRVVEYGRFERVGSCETVNTDVRIIAATNVDIEQLAAEGLFLPDLLDRLSFEALTIPPLRDRREDILYLAHRFAAAMTLELGRSESHSFSPEVSRQLLDHNWPGNIRELKNVVERAVYKTPSGPIERLEFLQTGAGLPGPPSVKAARPLKAGRFEEEAALPLAPGEYDRWLADKEKRLLGRALVKANFNQTKAAGLLGLTYPRWRALYRKYGLAEFTVNDKNGFSGDNPGPLENSP